MGIYAFRSGPSYRAATPDEQMSAALDMPLSLASTLGQQFKGGILDSLGLGTAIREMSLPEEAPTSQLYTTTGPNGETIMLPDTPQMRRRATVQGFELQRETPEQLDERRRDVGALAEDQYKSSTYYREGVKWDAGMTEDRAAALAEAYDAKRVREYFATKRPITSFIGNLAGQAVDPINYIPIAGPAVKAANAARFGRVAGAAATGSIDAALNTAIASGMTFDARKSMGDDITWQSTISDIAMSALIGSAFGSIGGVIDARRAGKLAVAEAAARDRLSTLRNVQDARVALNSAIDGIARGEDVNLGANGADAAQRIANANVGNIDPMTGVVRSHPIPADIEPVEVYHGTVSDFQRFDPKFLGKETDVGSARKAFFFSSDPRVSEGYAQTINPYNEGLAGKLPGGLGRLNKALSEGVMKLIGRKSLIEEGQVFRTNLRLENPMIVDRMGKEVVDSELEAALDAAKAAGHDGVIFKNSRDPGYTDASDIPSDVYAVFDPDKIDIISKHKSADDVLQYKARTSAAPDLSTSKPELPPAGKTEAEARIAKPETYKSVSEQYRVNPDDGSFVEQADIEQIRKEGRITPEDDMELNDAQEVFANSIAYGDALRSVVSCLI